MPVHRAVAFPTGIDRGHTVLTKRKKKEEIQMFIAPHGRTIRIDLPHLGDGKAWTMLTKYEQKRFLTNLEHLVGHYYKMDDRAIFADAGIKPVHVNYDKPVSGMMFSKAGHGILGVYGTVDYPYEKGVNVRSVFLDLSTAYGVCHFMRAVVDNRPIVRKRIRKAPAPGAQEVRKRKRTPKVRKRKRATNAQAD